MFKAKQLSEVFCENDELTDLDEEDEPVLQDDGQDPIS